MVDPNTRQGKRTPVTLKIKFKSETLEQFIERYAVDVSQGGIFIRTKEPLAVGTQMKFEFQLRDASPLIAGEGTVVWTRENDPSRPAIAPGMGVRFDRLAEGSQSILERILGEKAKQAPQRPQSETAKPPMFTDTPTRVAPAPVQEALLGRDGSQRHRRPEDSAHNDSHTPLPKPIPFHSDADEFPEEAFEEATKVRALDELIAQTAEGSGAPQENTARGRQTGRGDATITDPAPDRSEVRPTVMPAISDVQDVPDLPNPPEPTRPRLIDGSSPGPRGESSPPSLPDALAKTRLGEPARPRIGSSTPPSFGASLGEGPPLPSGMRAVAAEQTEPARMPPLKSRSMAPLLIVIFLVVAAGSAAVWFLVLRPQQADVSRAAAPAPEAPAAGSAVATAGSSAPAPGTEAPVAGSAAPGSAAAGSAAAGSATPTAAGPGSAAAKADAVDTVIGATADGAMVEVEGTGQSGAAPFTAKLEKGKTYQVRITAHGFATLELQVKGGDPKQSPKMVPKPRLISVSSDPPGAQISVDGSPTGHATPFDLELTPAQAIKKSVRIALRKPGFRTVDRTIDIAKFTEDETRMTTKLDEKLAVAPAAAPGHAAPGAGSAKPAGEGSATTGSDSGAGGGSAAPQGGSEGGAAAPAAPATPPATPPAASGGGGGASAGSAEPEPDFNKRP